MAKGTTVNGFSSIELSDDDEKSAKRPKIRRIPTECLNVECQYGENYIDSVPEFVLIFYKVRKKKGLKVCQQCFDEACSYFLNLREKFVKNESIYNEPSSRYKPVLNIDSDEEDLSPEDDEEQLNQETVTMIEKELAVMMKHILSSNNLHYQVNDSYEQLSEAMRNMKGLSQMRTEKLYEMQKTVDDMRKSVYEYFQPVIKKVSEVNIVDFFPSNVDKSFTKGRNVSKLKSALIKSPNLISPSLSAKQLNDSETSQDVVAVSEEILVPPLNLPPAGCQILRPKLKPGDIIYAMKHSYKYSWKKGCVTNIFREKGFNEYQLKIDVDNPKKLNPSIILSGKFLAFPTICSFRFTVGIRVIAVFKDEMVREPERLQYYSGIVAEPPKAMNKFRYLIFFDDGCAQYVPHEHIRLICEPSVNPWDDIPIDNKEFIKKYLLEYPERPMVKLQIGNVVKVEFESNWLDASVMEIDGSLVKMFFLREGRIEWIYRGSSRLSPLFKEFEAAKRRMQTGDRVRRITANYGNNSPYVEYTHNVDGDEIDEENTESVPGPRAVAKKSTASSANKLQKQEKPLKWSPHPIPGKLQQRKLNNVLIPKKFVAHQCGPSCIQWTMYDPSKFKKTIGPLAVPLNFGFRRIICHFGGGKRNVMYRAPCGRSLRNMEEVHMYLRITKSLMTVDFFDFDYWVNCLAEFVIEKANINIIDISHGKEECPINCVNYIDRELPNCTSYLIEREPRENVGLNLDQEFLCGCDCTDDCQDREKCSCWQMTIEGQKLIPNNMLDPSVGYHYRRLPERVITGIYECNQQCKCSKTTCLNRVVQYPLSQKLQLFKTEMKGWGIRCLNDIPQGAFICIYAGHLLTEHEANEEGKNYGDEYLAELDYIEVIERIKQDYESDVPEDLEEDLKEVRCQSNNHTNLYQKQDSPASSSSEDFNVDVNTNTRNNDNIRLRLRERKRKPQSTPETQANDIKKKEKKKLVSVRTYFGDNEGEVFIMDAKGSGNIGRYLNHSCMPNVFVQNVFVDTHDLRFPWVAFFAQTYIIAGTELTWDYNYDIGSVEGKIKYCYCGSLKCRGRLL